MKKNKIAILYIGTGEYAIFWKDFYVSTSKYFLPEEEKHYFVFTDSPSIHHKENVTIIHKICEGFPADSLFRFKLFIQIESEITKYDYIFFFNSNMLCIDYISKEEILPSDKELLGVISPGYYNKHPRIFPFERRKQSSAYIPYRKNQKYHYFMGGLNGGKSESYMKLIKTCYKNIELDYQNGIVALYHDESHINKYFYQHQNIIKILTPIYGYPEGWDFNFSPKIIIRDKTRYSTKFDKNKISLFRKIERKIQTLYRAITW